MTFEEFGKENDDVIFLLPGNLMCWAQFRNCIPYLEKKFRVVAVSFDGYDGTGKTTYLSFSEEADKLAEYIMINFGGHIKAVLGESLGCGPALFLHLKPQITVEYLILSGPQYMNYSVFNSFAVRAISNIQYKLIMMCSRDNFKMPWLLKTITGRNEAAIKVWAESMPKNISVETLMRCASEAVNMYSNLAEIAPIPHAKVVVWYGEHERNMKKAILRLKHLYPNARIHPFAGFGHGEIIEHPVMLLQELEQFLNS